jgi:type IV pilus assembly protein PilV
MKRFERGLSMIEILVTLTIVAFGLLGLLGLQARALSFQKDSFDRKAAAELISEFAERARANYEGVRRGSYAGNLAWNAGTPVIAGCASPCTWAQTAARDLTEWQNELRRRIPNSGAYIDWDPATDMWITITVAWPEPLQDAAAADAACAAVDGSIPNNYRCYSVQVYP